MATSVAHGLIGVAIYFSVRPLFSGNNKQPLNIKMLLVPALVANIPDLDMLISLLFFGDHRVLHGGISHTLFFALVGGAIVWVLAIKSSHRAELSCITFLILLSHVLVDFLTGPNVGFYPTHGATILWPFVESGIYSPVTIFKGVEHSNILPGALFTAFWEFVILAPMTAMIIYVSQKSN